VLGEVYFWFAYYELHFAEIKFLNKVTFSQSARSPLSDKTIMVKETKRLIVSVNVDLLH